MMDIFRQVLQNFQNSLVLHTVEIFFQFNFMKSSELDLNNLELSYWAWINFMMGWTWTWKILELPYWTRTDFIIYWS